jgi:hypothetical protein
MSQPTIPARNSKTAAPWPAPFLNGISAAGVDTKIGARWKHAHAGAAASLIALQCSHHKFVSKRTVLSESELRRDNPIQFSSSPRAWKRAARFSRAWDVIGF